MTSEKASSVEDSHQEVVERKRERKKGKPRHKFTKHDLEILNRSFEQNPFPDFSTRGELAKQMHCHICEINNWFQNKRSRLSSREKKRMFVARRRDEFPLQSHPVLGHLDAQMQYGNSATTQPPCLQQAPLEGAACFPMESWGLPSGEGASCESMFTGNRIEPSCASLGQENRGSGPSPNFSQTIHCHPASSVQHFERATFTSEESHQSMPLPYVDNVQGKMQKQNQALTGQPWLYEGQQQNDWRYYVPQLQWLQNCQEQLPFQDPQLMSQKHGDLGQQVPSFLQHWDAGFQSNGEALSSEMQFTSPPQMEGSSLPVPFVLDGQQGAAEQPRSPTQQLGNEGHNFFDEWAEILTEVLGIQF